MYWNNKISKHNAIREAICLFSKATGTVEFHQYGHKDTEEQKTIDHVEMDANY